MSIHQFMANFRNGYRPHAFKIEILGLPEKLAFMCRASNVPGKSIGKIEVPYKGRKIPIAGDPVYEDWTTTIVLDKDLAIWNEIEDWQQLIANDETTISSDVAGYSRTANIILYDNDDKEIAEYKLLNVWPSNVAPLELSHETSDEIATFEVTWSYVTRTRVK